MNQSSQHLLRDGTENVRGLSLVFGGSVIWNRDRFGRPCAWPADAFANIKELKLLELGDHCVEGDLGKLPQELVWLRWRNYPYECMPPNLRINHVRVLDFCGGKLVSLWDDQSQVPSKLQELNLQRCYKLQRVPDSIDRFRALQKLDFSNRLLLKTLSEEFCYLESLEVLSLKRCLNLEYLPSGFGGMRRLRDVSLTECKKLKALPESFGLLPQIEYLDMRDCRNVKIDEGSFVSISTLKEVNLLSCRKLETFPTQLTRQRSLKKLGVAIVDKYSGLIADFGHNEIFIDIPENFGELNKLTEVEMGNLTRIPQSIGKLSQLERFHLWGLANMRAIPDSIGNLSSLSSLHLRGCPQLQELPTSIGNLSRLKWLQLSNCPRLPASHFNRAGLTRLTNLISLDLSGCSDLQNITGLSGLRNLSTLNLNDYHKLTERASLDLRQCKQLRNLHLALTDSFLTEENSVLLENLISPSSKFTFTASAFPYPTAWLDSYHFQMMSKRETMPFVSGSSGLKCSLPAATTKKCGAIIICFVSVLQLIDELNDNQLAAPPLAQLCFELKDSEGNSILHKGEDFPHSKLGESIHLKLFVGDEYLLRKRKMSLNVLVDKLTSSVKGYLKYGWIKIIEKGEEKLIQQICGDFFRELRRQRPLAVARASAPSLLNLGNVHALDIANCTIRRTLYLYKTPIQEEKMELVVRKKQLFWRDDKELEHLDLSIMNTTSIPLFLTLKSIVNLYNMEVIISASSVEEAHKDELQEYQDNSSGHPGEELALFNQMQWVEVTPNSITIVSALQTCAHLGALQQDMYVKCKSVEVAHQLLDRLSKRNLVSWSALIVRHVPIYLLLNKVRDLIEKMPLVPGVSVWGRLLGAYKIYCNVDLGEIMRGSCFYLEPQKVGYCILLSNIYVMVRRWNDVKKVGIMMNDRGVKTLKGCISIEVNNTIHAFLMGDISHV
eukprot:Gb_27297 [translate_table: standard]